MKTINGDELKQVEGGMTLGERVAVIVLKFLVGQLP